MASGIKVDESCCHMWELFHKGVISDGTTAEEKEARQATIQNVLKVHSTTPEARTDSSDTDSSADEDAGDE